MKRRPVILCWGETLWDLYPDAARLGGCSANVAFHLSRLGGDPRLVSRVGNDEAGTHALARLVELGVDTSLVQVDPDAPTGAVRVEMHDGEPSFSIAASAAWDRIELSAAVRSTLETADALVFGTLAQRTPLGLTELARAAELAPPSALPVLDLNLREPFATVEAIEAALEIARVVKLNENEAERLGRLFGTGDVLDWLVRARGIERVALTRAEKGCVLQDRDERLTLPAAPLSGPLDAVGAGDAFAAVLALETVRQTPLLALGLRANRYAAAVASSPGAMPLVVPAR